MFYETRLRVLTVLNRKLECLTSYRC